MADIETIRMPAQQYVSASPEQTEELGRALAPRCAAVRVVALYGPMGAGKTAFVRGLARGLGVRGGVSSPTYAIVNEYHGERALYHFDLYRLSGAEELCEIGWDDYLASGALCAVEWSEIGEAAFPPDTLRVRFAVTGEHTRELTVTAPGETEGGA